MPPLEIPPDPAPTPSAPAKLRTGRYGELEEHELIRLLDTIDDERAKARFRESVYISLFVWTIVAWFLFYGPQVLFHRPRLVNPADVLRQRGITMLNAPVMPRPRPVPARIPLFNRRGIHRRGLRAHRRPIRFDTEQSDPMQRKPQRPVVVGAEVGARFADDQQVEIAVRPSVATSARAEQPDRARIDRSHDSGDDRIERLRLGRQAAEVRANGRHPTLPSSEIAISFCASTANSIGNCCKTSRTKPFTISAVASSPESPRCKQ